MTTQTVFDADTLTNNARLTGDEFLQMYARDAISLYNRLAGKYADALAHGCSPEWIAETARTRWYDQITRDALAMADMHMTSEYQTETNKGAIATANARYERIKAKATA